MDKIKLGIIGYGNMGTGHHNNVLSGACPEVEVVAICDINKSKEAIAKEKDPNIVFFDNHISMLDSGLVDSIIISTPHYFHPPIAIDAFRRNINVMSEKPVGVYTKAVKEMISEADKSKSVFGVMFNQRTNHVYRKMKELVSCGKYGNIRRVNWLITNWYRPQLYYDSGAWRATWSGEGGGVLLNQCPHQLDLLQWICGMPIKVDAKLHFGKWHDIEVEDDVTAYLEYPNGATGVFITSTGDGAGTNRFEIQMDGAKLVCENDTLTVTEYDIPEPIFTKQAEHAFQSPPNHKLEFETDGQNTQHVGVLNAFAGAILHGTPLVADGREGINGLTLSNAMHLSSFLGKEVELPFDDDLYYEELKKRIDSSKVKTNVDDKTVDISSSYQGNGK